jgi:hypothetical protein
MHEILPGILHWTTFHDGIGARVSSYYVEPAGALIDPRMPEAGTAAFAARERPRQVVLTTGLHRRHAADFAAAFGCTIRASPEALARLDGAPDADPYRDGEEVAPAITAIEIGWIAPDEYGLHIAVGDGALMFADGLVHYAGTLGFVPDALLGDAPETVKSGLRDAFRGLLTRDFDHLLFAHGDPLVGGGKTALRRFVELPVERSGHGGVL